MRKVLLAVLVMMCLGFTSAWGLQNACSVVGQQNITLPDGVLSNWQPATTIFSPAPDCAGTVDFTWENGRTVTEPYVGSGNTLNIGGVICNVEEGKLVNCKHYNEYIANRGWLRLGFPGKQRLEMYEAIMNIPQWPEKFTETPQINYSDSFMVYGYILTNWIPDDDFSPKPKNAGTVTLISPDGSTTLLPYVRTGPGKALVAGCSCEIVGGNLKCDVIEHYHFTFIKIGD